MPFCQLMSLFFHNDDDDDDDDFLFMGILFMGILGY